MKNKDKPVIPTWLLGSLTPGGPTPRTASQPPRMDFGGVYRNSAAVLRALNLGEKGQDEDAS